ncbi:MAG: hypothetical protein ABR500_02690 [Dermatophilaceae bacterium]|nr:hypothetical protein [Intrasporangiaceae bacterium]
MSTSSGPVRDEAWLRRERGRIARELHPDRGGSVEDYLAALAELERHAAGLGATEPGRMSIEVRTTLTGRVRRGRRRIAATSTAVGRGASRGVTLGRRLVGRPARPPRVL